MNHTLTTTLSNEIYEFLLKDAEETKSSKKHIIEEALKMYRKEKLRKAVEEGLKERYDEYKAIAAEVREVQITSIQPSL
mgnify:CR=1 FL=1